MSIGPKLLSAERALLPFYSFVHLLSLSRAPVIKTRAREATRIEAGVDVRSNISRHILNSIGSDRPCGKRLLSIL